MLSTSHFILTICFFVATPFIFGVVFLIGHLCQLHCFRKSVNISDVERGFLENPSSHSQVVSG